MGHSDVPPAMRQNEAFTGALRDSHVATWWNYFMIPLIGMLPEVGNQLDALPTSKL